MRKPKQRQQLAMPASKNRNASDSDLHGEDGWVIIKKQRVTILVPPLPDVRNTPSPDPGPSKLIAMPIKSANCRSTDLIETCTRQPSVDKIDNTASLAPNRNCQSTRTAPVRHSSALNKLPRSNINKELENPDVADALKPYHILGVSSIRKQPRIWHGPGSSLERHMLLNQRLRASLVERKLQKAGGLSRWLTSLGLGQFVKIFHGKNVSKFQLVSLTMKKLKDMGADAVGPRRKLMHAIDCICQPNCFGAF
ncbi:hypothetical protein K2173_024230 [Erythroxylum novogranatense]|uniref:SAM domain-containing protein n=1 Tax=Erythroxylum novogranatense TaxID=1862640 RepID=A0AAV8UDJ3_9ROSI|nr:hypothetical protein K2173_024230 [Erythroxylum novogranatense]